MAWRQTWARWLAHERRHRIWRVLKLAARDFFKDNGPSWAAAISYYSLLSLFPLLLGLGSVAAFFVEPRWAIQQATSYLSDLLPRGSAAIERIVYQSFATGRGGGLLIVLPLLWTGTLVFNAVTKALNVTFEAEDASGLWRRLLMRFIMLLTLGGMFVAALVSSVVLQFIQSTLGYLPMGGDLLFALLTNVLPALFMLVAFFLAYRFVPSRRPGGRAALAGAVLAALLFTLAKPLFLGYLQNLARYDLIYGSIAGIIVVVLWTWMVAMIGLYGGQVAFHCQAVLIEGHSIRSQEKLHLEREDSARLA